MEGLRVLIVHASSEVTGLLVEELARLGVHADGTRDTAEAVRMLGTNRYKAVLLDDELPEGGSLRLFDVIETEQQRHPEVLMVAVPRAQLSLARTASSGRSLEYVASPETNAEIERLALRIRSRLLGANIAGELSPQLQAQKRGAEEPADRDSSALSLGAGQYARILFGLSLVLLVLFLLFRILGEVG